MLRIIHAADFHLDSPFAALSEEQAVLRRREQRQLLASLAAEAKGADLVLLPGDLLDSGVCHAETAEALEEFLNSLPGRVFVAPGNHDYYAPESPWSRMKLGENIHIFTESQPEAVELLELGCTVWGSAFTSPRSVGRLRSFRAAGEGLQIMVLHGDVGGGMGYGPVSEEEIAASGLTYLALGHIHACSGLRRSGDTFWAYPGCTLGRGFDETGEKGAVLGTLEGEECTLEFRPLTGRRYWDLKAEVTGAESLEQAALAALPPDCAGDILRLTLTGEWEEKPRLEALRQALEGRCWSLTLRDETRLTRELWQLAEEDTLRGAFLRILRRQYEAAGEEQRERITRAARYGLAALEYREDL